MSLIRKTKVSYGIPNNRRSEADVFVTVAFSLPSLQASALTERALMHFRSKGVRGHSDKGRAAANSSLARYACRMARCNMLLKTGITDKNTADKA